ncbi:hypoxanthine phosphoribosyltransferase [archaeon]|nr:hypoxanthine phosphoribosyltransferase [archaeon]
MANEIQKLFITPQSLQDDSYRLARQVLDSGFEPDFLLALWRGGTPVGIAVQEFFKYKGVKTDHIPIRTHAYEGIDEKAKEIKVYGLDYVTENLNSNDKLLIVDDVFDTGLTMKAVLETLEKRLRLNMPYDTRIATVYFKPERNCTETRPDYFIHETDKWIYFPHELEGLSLEEIEKYKGKEIKKLLE